jgi:DNA polymerase III delta subunit
MLSEHTDAFAALKEDMPLLAASAHTFIVIESALLAADKKQFQKHAEVCEECVLEKAEAFNTFALADALLDRDKKKLWLLLLAARRAGVPEENTIGTLMWQMKALRLAVRTKSAEEAGLKAFPYTKAKRALTHWKGDDIDRASRELLVLYHDGHLGKRDIALALEEWILSI